MSNNYNESRGNGSSVGKIIAVIAFSIFGLMLLLLMIKLLFGNPFSEGVPNPGSAAAVQVTAAPVPVIVDVVTPAPTEKTPDPLPAPPTEEPLTATVGKASSSHGAKIRPYSADASSYINSNHIGERGVIVRYPDSAIDGDPSTSWQEAATDYGINQWLTVYFSQSESVGTMTFKLGNWEDSTSYKQNGRPSELRIDFSDGSSVTVQFSDKMSEYEVTLSKNVTTSWVKFTILGAYPGSKYEDTCISEIGFYS